VKSIIKRDLQTSASVTSAQDNVPALQTTLPLVTVPGIHVVSFA